MLTKRTEERELLANCMFVDGGERVMVYCTSLLTPGFISRAIIISSAYNESCKSYHLMTDKILKILWSAYQHENQKIALFIYST